MKKAISLILALVFVLSMVPAALAASFTDTEGVFGENAIERWAGYGVINGYPDKSFNPKGLFNRGGAMQLFAGLLALEDKADISAYTDVKDTDWYAQAVSKVVWQGLVTGTSETTMAPTHEMSRQMMFVLVGNALGVTGAEKLDEGKSFKDYEDVAKWARPVVNALVNMGVVSGKSGGKLDPNGTISRAEAAVLLDMLIGQYINKDGTYEVAGEGKNFTLSVAKNVTLTGTYNKTPIVVYGKGAKLNVSGVRGTAEYNVMSPDVTVTGAAVGTRFVLGPKATGLKVNGVSVTKSPYIVLGSGGSTGGDTNPPVTNPDKFTVTYTNKGDTYDTVEVEENTEHTVIAAPTAAANEVFTGWLGDDGKTYQPGDPITVTKDITLDAQWKTEFTVTYYNGEDPIDSFTVGAGDKFTHTIKSAEDLKLAEEGKVFVGWTDDDGAAYTAGISLVLSGDINLYAQWVDENDYIGIAVKDTFDLATQTAARVEESISVVNSDGLYDYSFSFGYDPSKDEGGVRKGNVHFTGSIEDGLAQNIITAAAFQAMVMLDTSGDSTGGVTPEKEKSILELLLQALEEEFDFDWTKDDSIRENMAKVRDAIVEYLKANVTSEASKNFQNTTKGTYNFKNAVVEVGSKKITLNANDGSGISVAGGSKRDQAAALFKALVAELHSSVMTDAYSEYTNEVKPSATVKVVFTPSDDAKAGGEYNFPTTYEFTVSLDLSSDGTIEYKYSDYDHFKLDVNGTDANDNIKTTYADEIGKVIDTLIEGDQIGGVIEGTIGDTGDDQSTLAKLAGAMESLLDDVKEGQGKEALAAKLGEWLTANMELVLDTETEEKQYDNTILEALVDELAEAAANEINDALDKQIEEADELMKKVLEAAFAALRSEAEPETLYESLMSESGLGQYVPEASKKALSSLGNLDEDIKDYIMGYICDVLNASAPDPVDHGYADAARDDMRVALNEVISEQINDILDGDIGNALKFLDRARTLGGLAEITVSDFIEFAENETVAKMLPERLKNYIEKIKSRLGGDLPDASVTIHVGDGITITSEDLKGLSEDITEGLKALIKTTPALGDLKLADFDTDNNDGVLIDVTYNTREYHFYLEIDGLTHD